MKLWELNTMISAVCPITGINSDKAIWFKPESTPEQQEAAQDIMDENISKVED